LSSKEKKKLCNFSKTELVPTISSSRKKKSLNSSIIPGFLVSKEYYERNIIRE